MNNRAGSQGGGTTTAGGLWVDKEIIGVGVCGLGRAGDFFHCRALQALPGFRLAAVFDTDSSRARQIAAGYNCPHYTTFEEFLRDPHVDMVVAAVPTGLHAEVAAAAAARGKHILVEKPFAASSVEAERIFELGERYHVYVGAFHNRRFDPDVRLVRQLIESGRLGELHHLSIHLHQYSRRNDWQTLRSLGGGALANWGAHALDWCIYLLGLPMKLDAASLRRVLNPGDAEDTFCLQLTSRGPSISIHYANHVALPLPKWHLAGSHGTAVSEKKSFRVRWCDPAVLPPLEVNRRLRSDGSYAFPDEIEWQEELLPCEYQDNSPPYYEALYAFLRGEGPEPVTRQEVLSGLRLIEEASRGHFREADNGKFVG